MLTNMIKSKLSKFSLCHKKPNFTTFDSNLWKKRETIRIKLHTITTLLHLTSRRRIRIWRILYNHVVRFNNTVLLLHEIFKAPGKYDFLRGIYIHISLTNKCTILTLLIFKIPSVSQNIFKAICVLKCLKIVQDIKKEE